MLDQRYLLLQFKLLSLSMAEWHILRKGHMLQDLLNREREKNPRNLHNQYLRKSKNNYRNILLRNNRNPTGNLNHLLFQYNIMSGLT